METAPVWEMLAAGVLAALLIFWFKPGFKAVFERSQKAQKDWPSVLIPLALVVLFVMLLIMMV